MGVKVPVGKTAMQYTSYPIKQLELLRTWAGEGPVGWAKLTASLAISDLILDKGLNSLGIDLSNAAGIGLDWRHGIKALTSYFKEGDPEKAKAEAQMALPALFGGPGGGMLPSGIFPVAKSLKDAAVGDFYKLIPIQVGRTIELVRAYESGMVQDAVTGKVGYPAYGRFGGPDQDVLMGTLSPNEMWMRTFGPKTAVEREWQSARFEEGIRKRAEGKARDRIVKLLDEERWDEASKMMETWGITPVQALEGYQIKKQVGVQGRLELERMKLGGARRQLVFESDSP